MRRQWFRLKPMITCLFVTASGGMLAAPAPGSTSSSASAAPWDFVTRSGSHLMLDGKPFRFSGANVEWLGLIGYGPLNFEPGQTERFPSNYEINDALATAKEMGATVIRAQTLGDTVGCANCLEPKLGQFNPRAFRVMDYAVMRARAYGIRLILEFHGDARAEHVSSSADIFSKWRGGANFWTDPTVIKDFENHIAHIVDHINSYTGIPYKDDPTILGWMDCNACQLSATQDGSSPDIDTWVATIADFVKSIDPRHLFISNAALLAPDARALSIPAVDAYAAEIYPHWFQLVSGDRASGQAPEPHAAAAETAAAGKVWMMSEFGWDKTNWATTGALQTFLTGIYDDPNISGDLFWALEGHANGHGWEPLVADTECQAGEGDTSPPTKPDPTGAGCYANEDGNWWALYYNGLKTLSNTAADMAARAQLLRAHAYQMRGLPVPPHDIPPRPTITQTANGRVFWQGSAGAVNYSVEQSVTATGPWTVPCNRCVTDLSNGWTEPAGGGCYRVIPYNLDRIAGPASRPAGTACKQTRKHPPAAAGCPPATGRLRGDVLGRVRLGMTRVEVRRAYTKSSDRGYRYENFFCLTPRGVRVGYASPALLATLPYAQRGRLSGRVVWASTASPFYSLRGVRAGETLAAAASHLRLTGPFHVGANDWYLTVNGSSRGVLKVRAGIVEEVGIADRALTRNRRSDRAFLRSFS